MNRSVALLIAALLAGTWLAGAATALPVMYQYSGTAEVGSLNGGSLGPRSFTLIGFADTDDVVEVDPNNIFSVIHSSTTIELSGVGTLSLLGSVGSFVNQGVSRIGLDDLNFVSAAVNNYELATPLGPILLGEPAFANITNVATDGGPLNLAGIAGVVFEAVVVPEPSTALLLGSGLLAVCLRRSGRG